MKNKKGCGCGDAQNKTSGANSNSETKNAKTSNAKKSSNTKNCG